jgi:hypothetical protein
MRACVAVALVALLVSCGGAKPAASPAPTDDAGRARLLVLTQTDLPDGWHPSKHTADAVADREDRTLAACVRAPDPSPSQTADVFGDVFGQGAQTISSEAVFSRTQSDAKKATAALKGARAIPCARASVLPVLNEQLRKQGLKATIRSIAVTRGTLAVEGFVSAFHIVVTLAAAGTAITIHEDVVVLARGRAQVRATFLDVGVAFSPAFELSLVKKLSGKLVKA